MGTIEACTRSETLAIEEIFHRIASDLALVVDHDIVIHSAESERWDRRPAGAGLVHVSFKLSIEWDGKRAAGCLLLPLPESITLAKYLRMVADSEVEAQRDEQNLDRVAKDAMLELSDLVANAVGAVLCELTSVEFKVKSEGCQGVRADVRPALDYTEGDSMVVGRAKASIHDFPEFEALLVLPELPLA